MNETNENKLVPKLRFPEFVENGEWQRSTIGEVGKFYYGKSAPKWSLSADAPTPCVRYGELYTKFDTIISKIYSRTNIDPTNLKFSKGGEILVPRVGEVPQEFAKNCCYLPFSNIAIGEMISVYETQEYAIFYAHYFRTLWKEFAEVVEGQNVKNLYYVNLEPISIGKPLISEQRKIADCLSSLDEVITAESEKLKALKEYKKGLLQNLFPQAGETVPKLRFKEFEESGEWIVENIESYIDLFSGIALKSEEITDDESGTPILRGINITEGYIRHSKEIDKYFTGDLEKLKKYLIKENDIVIGMDGSKVGKNVALVKKQDENSILIQRVARIRTNEKLDVNYVYQHFISNKFRGYVDTVNTSSGIPHISAQQIKDFQIGFPPEVEEQKMIVNCLSSVDDLISAQSQKVEALKLHKKGLLQGLFPQIND